MSEVMAEEAERAILGAILIEPNLLVDAQDKLAAGDFAGSKERDSYRAMLALSERREVIDSVTLRAELQRTQPDASWPEYVAGLIDGVPRAVSLDGWAEVVRRSSVQRKLIAAAKRIAAKVGECATVDEALDLAQTAVLEVSNATSTSGSFIGPDQAMKEACVLLDQMAQMKGVYGLPTGIEDYDHLTSGMRAAQLIVLAARPAQGKTAAAMTIADNVASNGKLVAFFSCEMSRTELTLRRLAKRSGIDYPALASVLNTGTEEQQGKITKAMGRLSTDNLYIDETPALTVQQVRTRARKLTFERKRSLDLIVVDYLQLLRSDRPENRQQEIATIARGLKNLAKEMQVPVLALSQLNRALEKRDDDRKRPILSDLRESGEIEQAADVIVFLHRDEQEADLGDGFRSEWIVAKQRNGATRTCYVRFHPKIMTFKDDTGLVNDGL